MKPTRTFLQQNAIRFCLKAEEPIYKLSKGKLMKNLFLSALDIPRIKTNVRIIKETENATYIAKFNPDGTFSLAQKKNSRFLDERP